jgi:hypothetical protein
MFLFMRSLPSISIFEIRELLHRSHAGAEVQTQS